MDEKILLLLPVLAVVTTIASVLLFWGLPAMLQRKRSGALRTEAAKLGLEFLGDGGALIQADLMEFDLLSQPGAKRIRNVMIRRSGEGNLAVFDLRIRTGSGQHSFVEQETVALIESERLDLPRFSMQPEKFYHRLSGMTGGEDIDFPERSTFNRHYFLQGEDSLAVREFFTDRIVTWLEIHPGWKVEAAGKRFVLWKHNKRVKPEDLGGFLSLGKELRDLLLG
jgi:hypothetical protein